MFCLLTDIYFSMNDKVKRRKKLFLSLSIIVISTILIMNGSIFPSAKAQTENCYNLESKNTLPVILIHDGMKDQVAILQFILMNGNSR